MIDLDFKVGDLVVVSNTAKNMSGHGYTKRMPHKILEMSNPNNVRMAHYNLDTKQSSESGYGGFCTVWEIERFFPTAKDKITYLNDIIIPLVEKELKWIKKFVKDGIKFSSTQEMVAELIYRVMKEGTTPDKIFDIFQEFNLTDRSTDCELTKFNLKAEMGAKALPLFIGDNYLDGVGIKPVKKNKTPDAVVIPPYRANPRTTTRNRSSYTGGVDFSLQPGPRRDPVVEEQEVGEGESF